MPVIKTTVTSFRLPDGSCFTMKVVCDKAGTFSIALPDPVAELLNLRHVTGKVMDTVVKEFDRKLAEFKAAKTVKTMVIVYTIKTNSYVMRDERCIHRSQQISFADGTTLSMAAAVYEKRVTTKADKSTVTEYVQLPSSIPLGFQSIGKRFHGLDHKSCQEMPWSRAREDFFARMGESLEQLIVNLTSLMNDGQSLARLASQIHTSTKLLTDAVISTEHTSTA